MTGGVLQALAIVVTLAAAHAYNSSAPELANRQAFPMRALQFDYGKAASISNSAAGQTYTMDLKTDPILATLPGPGLSAKVDYFAPCSIKVPHVHPRASKHSYVASGTLIVGEVEEDGGRSFEYTVPTGSSIVVPQGLLHFMKNDDCTTEVLLVTTWNNVDAGESIMFQALFSLSNDTLAAAAGIDQDLVAQIRNSIPLGAGDLRVDPTCLARCGQSSPSEATAGK